MGLLEDIVDGKWSTYTQDLPLFLELGLTPVKKAKTWEQVEVGTVEYRDDDGELMGLATIKVTGAPAQFWEFEIYSNDGDERRYLVKTGSGSLLEYWPMVKAMMEGMFVVEEL